MNRKPSHTIAVALMTALLIFIIAILLPKLVCQAGASMIIVTQLLEVGLSLAAIAILGKSRFAEYGFCRSRPGHRKSLLLSTGVALLLGIASSMAIIASGAGGHPLLRTLSFPQIILLVWFSSSIVEEIFTRGFLQGHLSSLEHIIIAGQISLPALISAVFFGLMHLILLIAGADLVTTTIIVCFTFSLGLLAAHQRSLTGSLVPSIIVHCAGNVGGFVGGILYVLFIVITTGNIPTMPH